MSLARPVKIVAALVIEVGFVGLLFCGLPLFGGGQNGSPALPIAEVAERMTLAAPAAPEREQFVEQKLLAAQTRVAEALEDHWRANIDSILHRQREMARH